jgi:hypothetical protein
MAKMVDTKLFFKVVNRLPVWCCYDAGVKDNDILSD